MAMSAEDYVTWFRYADGLDILHRVAGRLAREFSPRMGPDEAIAHFEARAIVLRRSNLLCEEAELWYLRHFARPS